MTGRPPIWVISLERAAERRAFVEAGFAQVGLAHTLVEATDGNDLTPAQLARCSQRRALFEAGRVMTRGDLGCSLSHLGVYARMVAEGIPNVVVMEDDAVPTPDLAVVLDSLDALPPDWDVVTFLSQYPTSGPVPTGISVGGRYQVCTYRKRVFGTQCYLVRLSAAHRLVEVGYPVALPADELLFRPWPAKLNVYGIEPALAEAGPFGSESESRAEVLRSGAADLAILDRGIVVAGRLWRRARDSRPRPSNRS